MQVQNSPFFGEDVVDLHLVVTHQFTCVGVEDLQRNFTNRSDLKLATVAMTPN